MAFHEGVLTPADTAGTNIITTMRSNLQNAGWANASNVFSRSTAGTTLTVDLTNSSFDANGNYVFTTNGVSRTLSLGHLPSVSYSIAYQMSFFDDLFWVRFTGMNSAGRANTYGSPSTSVCLTRYVPISASAQPDASKHWASIGFSGALGVHDENGTPWAFSTLSAGYEGQAAAQTCEFVTMRPAIQDIASVGDLLPSKVVTGGIIYWPYGIVNATHGYIGRLRNVFFGGETYTLAGDSTVSQHSDAEVYVSGKKYKTTVPYAYPTVDAAKQPYSAWGSCGGNNATAHNPQTGPMATRPGGPYIIVRMEA